VGSGGDVYCVSDDARLPQVAVARLQETRRILLIDERKLKCCALKYL